MEWVETTGRTVDEAKKSALEQLGVAEDEAEDVAEDDREVVLAGVHHLRVATGDVVAQEDRRSCWLPTTL